MKLTRTLNVHMYSSIFFFYNDYIANYYGTLSFWIYLFFTVTDYNCNLTRPITKGAAIKIHHPQLKHW